MSISLCSYTLYLKSTKCPVWATRIYIQRKTKFLYQFYTQHPMGLSASHAQFLRFLMLFKLESVQVILRKVMWVLKTSFSAPCRKIAISFHSRISSVRICAWNTYFVSATLLDIADLGTRRHYF